MSESLRNKTGVTTEQIAELFERQHDRYVRLIEKEFPDIRRHAEDVVSGAFVRMLKAREGFRGDSVIDTWAYRILLNAGKNAVTGKGSEFDTRSSPYAPDSAPLTNRTNTLFADPGHQIEQDETFVQAEQVLGQLSPKSAKAIAAVYEHDSYGAAADQLDVTVSAFKVQLHRGRANATQLDPTVLGRYDEMDTAA